MKILITGGLGFIGSNLAHLLAARGHQLTLVTRSREKLHNISGIQGGPRVIEMNVNKLGELEGVEELIAGQDAIFHLAGNMGNYSILGDPQQDIDDNCRTTLTLLELCRQHNPGVRMVFGSAFFVHGHVENIPVKEEQRCEPVSLFGATRLTGEHFCHIYNKVYDMNIVIARFANVYGIRERMHDKKKAAFNFLIRLALEGEEIPMYGKGDIIRDLVYVEDVASALATLMEKGTADESYFVGTGEGTTLKEFLDTAVEEAGAGSINTIPVPDFHKRIGITHFVCDISKLRALGWEPGFSLREGLRRTLEFYRKDGNRKAYNIGQAGQGQAE